MTKSSPPNSASAEALRRAGFVPLPRWWVKAHHMPTITAMRDEAAGEVAFLRAWANGRDAT